MLERVVKDNHISEALSLSSGYINKWKAKMHSINNGSYAIILKTVYILWSNVGSGELKRKK